MVKKVLNKDYIVVYRSEIGVNMGVEGYIGLIL